MSFVTGCVGIGKSFGVLAQLEDDHAEPIDAWQAGFWVDDKWCSEVVLDFKPVALTQYTGKPDTWVILGMEGEIAWIQGVSSGTLEMYIEKTEEGTLPIFTTIRNFQNKLIATGMERKVYFYDHTKWLIFGSGFEASQPDELVGFEALVDIENELYVCGWQGEIWRLNNNTWRKADSPTNIILTGAASHPSGEIFICGRLGTIIHGRGDRWALLDHQQTDEDFWSVEVFQGHTYFSSIHSIYELVDNRLIPVDDESISGNYYHLSANNQIMLSVGADAIRYNNGEIWKDILVR